MYNSIVTSLITTSCYMTTGLFCDTRPSKLVIVFIGINIIMCLRSHWSILFIIREMKIIDQCDVKRIISLTEIKEKNVQFTDNLKY